MCEPLLLACWGGTWQGPTHGSGCCGQGWVFLRSSRAMPAVCSFKHVWEKKMAFSYCIFAAEACVCQASCCPRSLTVPRGSWPACHCSASLQDLSKPLWVAFPKDRTEPGRSTAVAASPPAWQLWQSGDLPPHQCGCAVGVPGLTCSIPADSLLSRQGLVPH